MFFKRKELERLGCTKEEIELVLDYQKRLPILVENESVEGFCVNARDLFGCLNPNTKTKFSDWIKKRINTYNFHDNKDFIMISLNDEIKKGRGGDVKTREYSVTIAMAENLALVERTELGSLTREYFRLMRDIVKRNKEWLEVRFPERKEYKDMCTKLSEYVQKNFHREADKYDFAREANIINIIATGVPAQSIRNYLGVMDNDLTRDSLEKEYNERLAFLQKQNMIFLGMNLSIYDRTKMLISAFDVIYSSATPLLPWMTREGYENVRSEMLEQLRR